MSELERQVAVAGRYADVAHAAGRRAAAKVEAESGGAQVFQRHCAACHSISTPTALVGPTLQGVVGRRVGATAFDYSSALSGRPEKWTPASVVEFAQSPAGMYPGSLMAPVPMSPADRLDLQLYLAHDNAGVDLPQAAATHGEPR